MPVARWSRSIVVMAASTARKLADHRSARAASVSRPWSAASQRAAATWTWVRSPTTARVLAETAG